MANPIVSLQNPHLIAEIKGRIKIKRRVKIKIIVKSLSSKIQKVKTFRSLKSKINNRKLSTHQLNSKMDETLCQCQRSSS